MLVAFERFRLLLAEHQSAFLEWHDGDQIINDGVAAFLESPVQFENNPESFRLMLTLATTKFEILSKLAARDLRELHEHIVALEGQEKAEKVTGVPVSALKKLADLDTAMEIGRKWLGRVVQYTPWVYEIAKRLVGS
jgi:hypothetical protein